MNKQVDQLLQRKMDRKNFLRHVLLSIVMMSGAATLLKAFQPPETTQRTVATQPQGTGYGDSGYGGYISKS